MINNSILHHLIDTAIELIEYFWVKLTQLSGTSFTYPFFVLILCLGVGKIVIDLFNKLR